MANIQVIADNGSDLSTPPTLSLSFHPYTPVTPDIPILAELDVELMPSTTVQGVKIHTYSNNDGVFSFWRFMLDIPLHKIEVAVRYTLNKGSAIEFVMPKVGQNLRWAAHSCNGE